MAGAWIEVPDDSAGWGPVRVLCTRLDGAGYRAEEFRIEGHIMVGLTGSRLDSPPRPPQWRGAPRWA